MLTDIDCSGVLHTEDGLVAAKGVILSMALGQENRPLGLGDIKGVLVVHDDPMFVGRNVDKQFVFVPAVKSEHDFKIHLLAEDGACIAFPVAKSVHQ